MGEIETVNNRISRGDRFDGVFLDNLDPLHMITAILYPNRCDNEAYISETIDLTEINKYIDKKNSGDDEFKYTLFHLIVTAMLKTVMLRPKMNRFIVNGKMYQRRWVTGSFVVKKKFSDRGEEALAIIKAEPDDNIDSIHEKLRAQIYSCRDEDKTDESTQYMKLFNAIPFGITRAAVRGIMLLDKVGKVPRSMIATDPYYTSVVLTNLGSIKLKCGYHHLTNWGTNSVFVVIGEKKLRPFFKDDGTYEMRDSVQLGLTIDERIGDGYYYSKSIRLLKKLLENPTLLEEELSKDIEY